MNKIECMVWNLRVIGMRIRLKENFNDFNNVSFYHND